MTEPHTTRTAAIVGGSLPPIPPPPLVVIAGLIVFFAITAVHLGTDATPDFRIYHYYNGFKAFHDRSSLDIVPAQLQTMLFNGIDAIDYGIIRIFDRHPVVINVIFSIPYSIAAVCTFMLARLLLPQSGLLCVMICTAVALFGLTGAGELPTLATAMTDVTADVPFLIALVYWSTNDRVGTATLATPLVAGLLAGASVGLKLTTVPFFIGFFVMITSRQMLGVRGAWREALVFGMAGLIAFLVIDVHWLLDNMRTYGNPIMPNMNNIFKSDFVTHSAWTDGRFLPKTALMAAVYPAYWAFQTSQDTIELPMRDPRILIGCVSSLVILVLSAYRKIINSAAARHNAPSDRLTFSFAVIFLVAYVLWEMEWSIYRYLAIDECLSGLLLLAALVVSMRSVATPLLAGLAAVIALPAAATTEYPWWSRAIPAQQAVSVSLPAIEPNAMVIFLDPYAYSYLVPSMPLTVRVVGANNNIVHPGAWGKLQAQVAVAIDGHNGPFWGLEFPQAFPGTANSTLAFYHLHRTVRTCVIVRSNIEDGPHIRICALARD